MRHIKFQKGSALLDLLVASTLALIVGAAIVMFTQTTYKARDLVQGQANTDVWARKTLDTMADSIRNAQSYQIQSSPVVNAALAAAGASSITCYTDSAGDYAQY